MADELDGFLFNHGMPCTSIYADRTQRKRENAINHNLPNMNHCGRGRG